MFISHNLFLLPPLQQTYKLLLLQDIHILYVLLRVMIKIFKRYKI